MRLPFDCRMIIILKKGFYRASAGSVWNREAVRQPCRRRQVSRHVNIYCKICEIFESTRQTHDDRTICHVNTLCGPVHVFCNVKAVRQLQDCRKVVSRISSFWISTPSLLNTSGSCSGRVAIVEKVHVVKHLSSSWYYILYFVVQTINVRLSHGVPTTAFWSLARRSMVTTQFSGMSSGFLAIDL